MSKNKLRARDYIGIFLYIGDELSYTLDPLLVRMQTNDAGD